MKTLEFPTQIKKKYIELVKYKFPHAERNMVGG